MISQALFLVGGLGTRLGTLTQDQPKPMIPIGDRPFMEHILTMLIRHGIRKYIFCVGYHADKIQNYFEDGRKWNSLIQYSVEQELLGTGGAIKKASSLLDSSFVLINGDNYLPLDYSAVFSAYDQLQNAVGMVVCWKNDHLGKHKSNLTLDSSQSYVSVYDYYNSKQEYMDCGVKIFSRRLISYLFERNNFSLEIEIMPKLAANGLLYSYLSNFPPLNIGTPEELIEARNQLLNIH